MELLRKRECSALTSGGAHLDGSTPAAHRPRVKVDQEARTPIEARSKSFAATSRRRLQTGRVEHRSILESSRGTSPSETRSKKRLPGSGSNGATQKSRYSPLMPLRVRSLSWSITRL